MSGETAELTESAVYPLIKGIVMNVQTALTPCAAPKSKAPEANEVAVFPDTATIDVKIGIKASIKSVMALTAVFAAAADERTSFMLTAAIHKVPAKIAGAILASGLLKDDAAESARIIPRSKKSALIGLFIPLLKKVKICLKKSLGCISKDNFPFSISIPNSSI